MKALNTLDTVIQLGIPPILILAQALPLPDATHDLYLEAIRSLGVLIVLAWYLWYNTSVSQPRLLDSAAKEREMSNEAHRAERASMAQAVRSESDQKRVDFLAAIADQRHEFQETLQAATNTFTTTIEKISCKYEDPPCSKG